jgi:uncharacterized protein YjbI with pentapeptide repeats
MFCLMHSMNKGSEGALFETELRTIIEGRSEYSRPEQDLDFSGFVFVTALFQNMTLSLPAHFDGARFMAHGAFVGATFAEDVTFTKADFQSPPDFSSCTFSGTAAFIDTGFSGASFREAAFLDLVTFEGASFSGEVTFEGARFADTNSFEGCQFSRDVSFNRSTFSDVGNFREAIFIGLTSFTQTLFTQGAIFTRGGFKERALFLSTNFGPPLGSAKSSKPAIADLSDLNLDKAGGLELLEVNLGSTEGLRLRVRGTDLPEAKFQSINWHRQRGRLVLQDEIDAREAKTLSRERRIALCEGAIAAYRRLQGLFDGSRQIDLAEDCYCGTMEVRRLNPSERLFSRFIIALYGMASAYGSSYVKALGVLVSLLLVFGIAFGIVGLEPSSHMATTTLPWIKPEIFRQMLRGIFHALQVATFQRETRYSTVSSWGSMVSVVETIVIPAQLALLLFALNRRFKR